MVHKTTNIDKVLNKYSLLKVLITVPIIQWAWDLLSVCLKSLCSFLWFFFLIINMFTSIVLWLGEFLSPCLYPYLVFWQGTEFASFSTCAESQLLLVTKGLFISACSHCFLPPTACEVGSVVCPETYYLEIYHFFLPCDLLVLSM